MPPSLLRPILWALGAVQLLTALSLALLPGSFYEALADFGPRNDHDLRDMSAFYFAAAVALFVAARRPSWRVPVLALVGMQYSLHAVNHLIDVADADPGWVGPFDVVALVAIAGVCALALRAARRAEGDG
jgi:hypothetical protein